MMSAPTRDRDAPVVLITGAAGGLGRALVDAFRRAGWGVVAGMHRTAPPAEWGAGVWPVFWDVTLSGDATRVVSDVMEGWGRIDVLVNNAAVAEDGALWQLDEAAWDRVLQVGLRGAMICARAALAPMMARREGHVLNIASHAGRTGARGQSNYAAAKAGLIGFTQALAREGAPHNVRANVVLPGVLPTGMTRGLDVEQVEALVRANLLGRMNSLEEVAGFVVFLARTRNISGQCFQLDSRVTPWS